MTAADRPDQRNPGVLIAGPEVVGIVLALATLGLLAGLVLMRPTGESGGTPSGSARPSAAAGTGTAASSSPGPSVPPFAGAARTALRVVDRIGAHVADLEELLADDSSNGRDLKPVISSTTSTLRDAAATVAVLARAGAPDELVAALRGPIDEGREIGEATLDVTVGETRAYRTGAADLVKTLKALEAAADDLAAAAGVERP